MRVLRIYHGGRTASHRARERALVAAGVDVVLVVPDQWSEGGAQAQLSPEPFPVVELPVVRPDDVNRHSYADAAQIRAVVADVRPDLVDVHEEPFSTVAHQVLGVLPRSVPVVTYTAQNLDKRYPPPYTGWERKAFARISGIYPCSRQAAAVARGRGFTGHLDVIPLGVDPARFRPGEQRHDDGVFRLALAGRMVPEKGVVAAVEVLAVVRRHRPAELVLLGAGPETVVAESRAGELGVGDNVRLQPWVDEDTLAAVFRGTHVVLVPSSSTSRWVEQFGRTVVEGQASGAVVAGYASGAIPEAAGGGAWLAAEHDVVGLGRAAARLAVDTQAWSTWRNAGFTAAADKTWSAVAHRQRDFYERALVSRPRPPLVAGPTTRRRATEEFGSPARTGQGVVRPMALPVIRDHGGVSRGVGAIIDLAGTVRATVSRRPTE